MSIGTNIRKIRLNQGLSQAKLVEGLFDRSYLSQIEKGHIVPPLDTIRLLAVRLGVLIKDIISEEDYLSKIKQAELLLQRGKRMGNRESVQHSWIIFYELKFIDRMLESIMVWSTFSQNDTIFVDALSTTIALATIQQPLHPLFWDASLALGNVHFEFGLYDRSAKVYRELIMRHPPKHVLIRSWVNLGSSLIQLLEFEEAQDAFEHGIKLWEPKWPRILPRCHHGLGVSYRAIGKWDKSYHHTMEAHNIYSKDDSKFFETLHNLGVLWLDKHNFDCATTYLSEALEFYQRHNMYENVVRILEEFTRLHFYQKNYITAHQNVIEGLKILQGRNGYIAGRLFLWKCILYHQEELINLSLESLYAAQAILGHKTLPLLHLLSPGMGEITQQIESDYIEYLQ